MDYLVAPSRNRPRSVAGHAFEAEVEEVEPKRWVVADDRRSPGAASCGTSRSPSSAVQHPSIQGHVAIDDDGQGEFGLDPGRARPADPADGSRPGIDCLDQRLGPRCPIAGAGRVVPVSPSGSGRVLPPISDARQGRGRWPSPPGANCSSPRPRSAGRTHRPRAAYSAGSATAPVKWTLDRRRRSTELCRSSARAFHAVAHQDEVRPGVRRRPRARRRSGGRGSSGDAAGR